MKQRVICTFHHYDQLKKALSKLRARGFSYSERDVILSRWDQSPVESKRSNHNHDDDYNDDESWYATKASIYMGALLGAAMSGASRIQGISDWLLLATGAVLGATICGILGAIVGSSIASARTTREKHADYLYQLEKSDIETSKKTDANTGRLITFKTKATILKSAPLQTPSPNSFFDTAARKANLDTTLETNLIVTVQVDPGDSIAAVEKICRMAGAEHTMQVRDAA